MIDTTRNYYQTYAEDYFRSTCSANVWHVREKFYKKLGHNAFILDLGCGSGRDLKYFASQGIQTIGLDYAFNLVKLSNAFSQQTVVLGDFQTLPFLSEVFDAAWAMGALLHIPRQQVSTVLSEIHRVLKRNAVFFSSVKKGKGQEIEANGRYFEYYQRAEWGELLDEAQFLPENVEEIIEQRKTDVGEIRQITWIQSVANRL